jgi:hypothetical protein
MSRVAVPGDGTLSGGQYSLSKLITAVADNTATVLFTVLIPNATGSCFIDLDFLASLGAGGAVGAFENNLTAQGRIIISRIAGAAMTASAIALFNAGSVVVAGGDAATLAYSETITVNTAGAQNTMQIKVTIHDTAGSATNHQCYAIAGITAVNGLQASIS